MDPRFNGPPGSGQGGWSAGLLADVVGGAAVEVSLLRPPPLGRPLRVAGGEALDGDDVVLRAQRVAAVAVEPRPPVAADLARATTSPWDERHPFPTCFACGPERAEGDGLRLFAGRARDDGTYAVAWTPDPAFGDPVPRPLLWAAMDCPTAAPLVDPPPRRPLVLARLAVQQHAPVRAGAEHVVGAWTVAVDGRKRRAAAALWAAGGELLAVASALWIELR